MADPKDEKRVELRLVDDEPSSTEEVLRLDRGEVVPVGRLELEPEPERAEKLGAEAPEFQRRSHEPGVEKLIEEFGESVDPEELWVEPGRRAVPYGWFVLILLMVVSVVVASLWWGREGEGRVEEVREVVKQRVEGDELAQKEAEELVRKIEDKLRDYTLAHDPDSLLRHVRDPERVEPLIADWYSRHEPGIPDFARMGGISPLFVEGMEFWQAAYENELGRTRRVLLTLVNGEPKVDWETDVCYQPLPWDEYVKRLPEGVALDFRVYCVPDAMSLYSHEFQNEADWRAYQLTALNAGEYLMGYASRDGAVDRRLREIHEGNQGRPVTAVLRLRRPSGAVSPRGVVIEEIVSENWVIVRKKP